MALPRSLALGPVARRTALACLGLAMLLVGGAVWPMIYGLVRALGVLSGDVAIDAVFVSVLTALVLAGYVAIVTRWWYDRETSLFVGATLFALYGSYFYLVRDAFWI